MTQNEALFNGDTALTFDDVLVVPDYTEVLPDEVDISVALTPEITLNVPILSAAMDTVTEGRLAIALAREGGLGILHRNMSIEEQAAQVEMVKRSESGMIVDPITLPPTATLQDAEELMAYYRISGVPIVDPDNNALVGILTNRDVRFVEKSEYYRSVTEFMTRDELVTAPVGTTLEQAVVLLQKHRIEKLLLVDDHGNLKGLITVKDIQKRKDYPRASLDSSGRLLAGAAIGVGPDVDDRVAALVEEEVDVVAIDTAHGHSKGVIDTIKRIKAKYPDLPILAGNVVTKNGTLALIEAGASGVKVGVGAGSICTTRIVAGAGMPQMSAIYECAQAAKGSGIPTIADGGIKYSGEIVKALAAGAHMVMLGSLLAGLKESPGEEVLFEGRLFKEYRGMGSMGAMQGYGKDRYGTGQKGSGKLVPEGIEGRVPFKGTLHDYVYQLVGGLRSGMGYAGAANLQQLRNETRLQRISNAGLIESHPHDVQITKEAPNYQVGDR